MSPSATSVALGSCIGIFSGTSIILNICTLIVIKKAEFLSGDHCQFYVFAFANITGNLLTMTIYVGYLTPISIFQNFIFEGGHESFWVKFMGYLFHSLWLTDLMIQMVTSINRAIVVLKPSGSLFFTRNVTFLISLICFIFGFFLAYVGNFLLPCCSFYLYYGTYGYTYLPPAGPYFNYGNYMVAIPLNILCSIVPLICYSMILLYVRKSNQQMTNVLNKSVYSTRKKQELRYAFQLSICTGVCVSIWVFYRILSFIFVSHKSPIFIVLTFLYVFHCSANSLVFLIFNKEVRRKFQRIILRMKVSNVVANNPNQGRLPGVSNSSKVMFK